MKSEHEQYFSAKMHELADTFNAMAQVVENFHGGDAALGIDSNLHQMHDHFHAFTKKVSQEFEAAGYSTDDWNDLMIRSGAGKKMGM